MNQEDRALVVALRMTQWLLDDAAHAIPNDDFRPERRRALADELHELADVMLASTTVVVDQDDGR